MSDLRTLLRVSTPGFFSPETSFFCIIVTTILTHQGCWRTNSDRGKASECLHVLSDKSNKNMDELINKTVMQIKGNNTGPVYKGKDPQQTIGDVFSKFFLDSQNSWKEYRKNFCLGVGSQIGEDTYDYWPYIYQCQINLNKRHAEEIKILHADEE